MITVNMLRKAFDKILPGNDNEFEQLATYLNKELGFRAATGIYSSAATDDPKPIRINPGDVVKLKSGGEKMTVAYEVSHEASPDCGLKSGVHCYWHSKTGEAQHDVYRKEQLDIIWAAPDWREGQ